MIKNYLTLFLFIFCCSLFVFPVKAATFDSRIKSIENDLGNPDDIKPSVYREKIKTIRDELSVSKTEIALKTKTLQQTLDTVNAAIKDVQTPPPEIQKQIDSLNKEISDTQAEGIDLNLMSARIDKIETKINEIVQQRLLSDVQIKQEFPFSPTFIKEGLPEIISTFYTTLKEPYIWIKKHIEEQEYKEESTIYFTLSIMFVVICVVVVKRTLLRHFAYKSEIEDPSYASKLIAAFIDAVSKGIFPAAILGVILYWFIGSFEKGEELIASIIQGGIAVLIYMVLIHSFAHTIFSPNLINWRLTTLSQRQSRKVYSLIILLGAVFCFHIFFFRILVQTESNQFAQTLFTVLMNITEAFLFFALLNNKLWRNEAVNNKFSDNAETINIDKKKFDIWWFVRFVMSLVMIVSGIASFLGYVGFGDFVIKRVLYSSAIVSLLVVLRSFFHETTLLFINSEYAISTLGLNQKKLKISRFWLLFLLDILLICAGAYLVLPLWGVPRTDVINFGKSLVTGFSVGGVTISLVNIFMAILVFFIVAKIFGWLQKVLKTKIFSATDMESSLQDSVSAGIRYIGMIMGFIVSVSVLGINFTNLAIVAGALSVGIGFGLQNIVNNFVSGVIILLERPIKVGDWIIINGNEGVVSRISFRATEIETFKKASILIPNAEIISNVLLNWTHNDNYGRVDIPVSVSYKSDVEKIKEILLNIASQNSKVLFVPQPVVFFLGIDEDSMKFELRFFVSDVMDSIIIGSDIRYNIVRKFREENIEIPYRHQIMHIKTNGGKEEFSFDQEEIKQEKLEDQETDK